MVLADGGVVVAAADASAVEEQTTPPTPLTSQLLGIDVLGINCDRLSVSAELIGRFEGGMTEEVGAFVVLVSISVPPEAVDIS